MGTIVVELTDRCNLSCDHCLSGRHGGRTLLSLEVLRKVLDEARSLGFTSLGFTGGDPTLHPQYPEIIRMTAQAGYRFGVVTNGWNFPGVYPAILEQREALSGITFSFDGASEQTHDAQRGAGSYRRVLRAFAICVVERLPFTINMVLTARNRHEVGEMARLGSRLGAALVRFGHLMLTLLTTAMKLDLTPEERRTVEQEIRNLQTGFDVPLVIAPGYYTTDLFPCGPLRGQDVNIDCRGNLTKCCHLSGHGEGAGQGDVIGNLAEMGFAEAWRLLVEENARFREEKERLNRQGELLDSDLFPCWYCSLYYRKVDWLRKSADHPWGRLHCGGSHTAMPSSQLLEKIESAR